MGNAARRNTARRSERESFPRKSVVGVASALFVAALILAIGALGSPAEAQTYPAYPSSPHGTTVLYLCPPGSVEAGGSGPTLQCAVAGTVSVPVSAVSTTKSTCPPGTTSAGSGSTLTCTDADGNPVTPQTETTYACPAGSFATSGSGASLRCAKTEATSSPVAAVSTIVCQTGYEPVPNSSPFACRPIATTPATTPHTTPQPIVSTVSTANPATTVTLAPVADGQPVAVADAHTPAVATPGANQLVTTPPAPVLAITGTSPWKTGLFAIGLLVTGVVLLGLSVRALLRMKL